jgi:uncharacterized membrane protein
LNAALLVTEVIKEMQATNMIKNNPVAGGSDQVLHLDKVEWAMLPQTTASLGLNMKSSKDFNVDGNYRVANRLFAAILKIFRIKLIIMELLYNCLRINGCSSTAINLLLGASSKKSALLPIRITLLKSYHFIL